MRPPNFLAPALELLQENLDILPATGGAVEDMLRVDVDEVEDMLIYGKSREATTFLEIPTPDPRNIYHPTPPIYRDEKHLYRYYIDGSIRTYYLATGIESNRTFPIELAQIGAAVMHRNEHGNMRPVAVTHPLTVA